MKRIESTYSCKAALCLHRRATLFDKRALGYFRKASGGRIPRKKKLLLILSIQIKRKLTLLYHSEIVIELV